MLVIWKIESALVFRIPTILDQSDHAPNWNYEAVVSIHYRVMYRMLTWLRNSDDNHSSSGMFISMYINATNLALFFASNPFFATSSFCASFNLLVDCSGATLAPSSPIHQLEDGHGQILRVKILPIALYRLYLISR